MLVPSVFFLNHSFHHSYLLLLNWTIFAALHLPTIYSIFVEPPKIWSLKSYIFFSLLRPTISLSPFFQHKECCLYIGLRTNNWRNTIQWFDIYIHYSIYTTHSPFRERLHTTGARLYHQSLYLDLHKLVVNNLFLSSSSDGAQFCQRERHTIHERLENLSIITIYSIYSLN